MIFGDLIIFHYTKISYFSFIEQYYDISLLHFLHVKSVFIDEAWCESTVKPYLKPFYFAFSQFGLVKYKRPKVGELAATGKNYKPGHKSDSNHSL